VEEIDMEIIPFLDLMISSFVAPVFATTLVIVIILKLFKNSTRV